MNDQNQIKPRFLSPGDSMWLSPWGLCLRPIPKHPEAAARVLIFKGKFPFPVRKINGRNVVAMPDIDTWTPPEPERTARPAVPELDPPKRRRGRPRKVSEQ